MSCGMEKYLIHLWEGKIRQNKKRKKINKIKEVQFKFASISLSKLKYILIFLICQYLIFEKYKKIKESQKK